MLQFMYIISKGAPGLDFISSIFNEDYTLMPETKYDMKKLR